MSGNKTRSLCNKGPDFIGIGAARSGTTWLASQLGARREIWMPKRKELHYFSRKIDYLSPSHFHDESLMKRFLGCERRNLVYKRKFFTALGGSLLRGDLDRLFWECRYFLGDSSLDWYRSLFPNDSRITGEITPAYSLLTESSISEIVKMNPEIKILYVIRNPIERAWSTIKYHEKRGHKGLTDENDKQILGYLNQPHIVKRADYVDVIGKWAKYVDKSNFLLLFYDDIVEQPASVISRLENFLGLERKCRNANDAGRKINNSFDKDIPARVRASLCDSYYESIYELSHMVGGTAYKWLGYVNQYSTR